MFLNPDFFENPSRRLVRVGLLASVAVTMLAVGCANSVGQRGSDAATTPPETPSISPSPVLCQPVTPVAPVASLAADPIIGLLAYAERARRMPPAELGQEVIRLGDAAGPTEQVQLALVLSQFHLLPELIRAQDLLGRVLANAGDEAKALHPLAGLLAARLGEQRRLEDLLDKQTQQTREVQRRLDQTNERLEALKAIERSLTNRPPPASNSRGNHAPSP